MFGLAACVYFKISKLSSTFPLSPLPSSSSPAPIHSAMVDKLPSSPSILWRLYESTFQHPIPFPLPFLPPCLKNPMPHPLLSLYYALSFYPTDPFQPPSAQLPMLELSPCFAYWLVEAPWQHPYPYLSPSHIFLGWTRTIPLVCLLIIWNALILLPPLTSMLLVDNLTNTKWC